MLPELARAARLDTSFSGIVSFAMRSREGELLARFISCITHDPHQHECQRLSCMDKYLWIQDRCRSQARPEGPLQKKVLYDPLDTPNNDQRVWGSPK